MSPLDGSILLAFLKADGGAVSGDQLAKALGVSRVAVWGRLEKLREQGFAFEAAPRKGYRLAGTPRAAHGAWIEAHLRRRRCQVPCEVLASVDSTNSEAERRLAAGAEAPFAVLATRQGAGRGRLGRAWRSDRPGNLYLSLAFRPFLEVERLGPFTVWMGLALCEHLESELGARLALKWPNDLLDAGGRKVAGMLTEARIDSDVVRDLVFGLGLNLEGPGKDWPEDLRRRTGALSAVAGRELDPSAVAAGVVATLAGAWEAFADGAFRKRFRRLHERHDALAGKAVRVTLRGKPLSGVAEGIDDDGALRLRTPKGKLVRVASGEVTLRGS
jgi:BirA family transcriptional regulator, biotin operon repressor / biotin---[acetyl-CoA-carboxylase] ligase